LNKKKYCSHYLNSGNDDPICRTRMFTRKLSMNIVHITAKELPIAV
jgi:hypothetical protein